VDDRSSARLARPTTAVIVYVRFPRSNGPERSILALGGALHVRYWHRSVLVESVRKVPSLTGQMKRRVARTIHPQVSRITVIDGAAVTLFDGLPASASRRAVGIVGSGSGSSDAPSLVKRCAACSGHQGQVLVVLAMLAAKRRLRVAPRGCALPLTAAARDALGECRPGRRNGTPTELRNMTVGEGRSGRRDGPFDRS
jgi:hypothetical protein